MPQHSDTNTSPPTGYYEKLQGGRKSRPPSRAEKHRECDAPSDRPYDRNKFNITKHDCLNKEASPPTRSQSLPPRPPTRRKLADMPIQRQYSSRARSSGPASRRNSAQKTRSARSQRSTKATPPVFAHFSASVKPNSTREADHIEANERSSTLRPPAPTNEKSKRDTSFKSSISDHEYLQFSLRITEDIIRNDLYTNKEMRRVFNSHLEANRGRLDMDKMTQQIDSLCKELNIPLNETQDDDLTTRSQIKAKRNNLSCICGPTSRPLKELKDCECGSTRRLPFQCVQHCFSNTENIENNTTTCSTSMNTTSSSQGTMKDEIEEVEEVEDDFVDIQVFENPEIMPMTTNSTSELLPDQEDDDMYDGRIPYYDELEYVSYIRPSVGFFELPLLPSLSRVTEKTEPTTSCETLDVKLETSDSNASVFDVSDVLPVFEHLDQQEMKDDFETSSLSSSLKKKKGISFRSKKMKQMQSNSMQQKEENEQEYLVSTQPETSASDEFKRALTKPEAGNCIQQTPSSAGAGNVFWIICPCGIPHQPTPGEVPRIHNEEEKSNSEIIIASTSIKSVPGSEPQTKTVCSTPSTCGAQSPCISFTTPPTIPETRSEPIKHSPKMPIPAPRSCSFEARDASSLSFEIKSLDLVSLKESATESNDFNSNGPKDHIGCNYDNKKNESQIAQLPESSNVKVCGPNNREDEFILVPGPIYIPKSSIIPIKSEIGQNIPMVAPETVIRDICSFSRDAMVNTDEQWSCDTVNSEQIRSVTSSAFKVSGESSLASTTKDNMKQMRSVTSSAFKVSEEPNPASTTTDSIITSSTFKVSREPSLASTTKDNIKQIQNVTSTLKGSSLSLSSTATDNTKEIETATSSTLEVIREPRLSSNTSTFSSMKSKQSTTSNSSTPVQSGSMTYSQIHNSAINVIHVTSLSSNVSRVSDMPARPTPISESVLMTDKVKKSISKPPKAITRLKDPVTHSGESTALIHLNDYDLTPQRDSNRSIYGNNTSTIPVIAENQPFSYNNKFTPFSKESLLLGDEYEIKNDFASNKSSISSCYDNGLPYTICRFYPNISTQTRSSDFLFPAAAPIKLTNSNEQHQDPIPSPTGSFNKGYVQEPQEQRTPSILKKKKASVKEQEPEKPQEMEEQEPEKQEKPLVKQEKPLIKQETPLPKQEKPLVKQEKPLEKQENPLEKQESDMQQEPEEQQGSRDQQEQSVIAELFNSSSDILTQRVPSIVSEKSVSFGSKRDKDSISEFLDMNNEEEIFEHAPENKEEDDYVEEEEYRPPENEQNDEEEENEVNEDRGANGSIMGEINEGDNIHVEEEELEEDDEDPFEVVDDALSNAPRASIMMTIKQVTHDLEKFRTTEIPVDEFVQTRYNIPMQNRTLSVAEDLLQQQAQSLEKKSSVASKMSSITDSFSMGSASKLPFIEVSNSEPNLETKQEVASESEQTVCCGLRKGKKKSRRDIMDASAHKIPNISSIPDDQLFEMEARRPTVDAGYGHERKSLRFDYSAMGQYSKNQHNRRETLEIKDFTSAYSAELSLANITRAESEELAPVVPVRNPIVSYRTPSIPQQPKCDQTDSVVSAVQFNKSVRTLDSDQHNSVVDILIPQNTSSMLSIQMSESVEN